jgi:hypothetical protein
MSQKLGHSRGGAPVLGSSPDYRWNAVPSSHRVRVLRDGVAWEGAGVDGASVRLSVTVQVREALQHTRVWLDVYSFDADGGLVGFDTHDLRYTEPAGDGGHMFVFDGRVWGPGLRPLSGATPVPRTLKYRVYMRPEAGLFTDGMLHGLTLPATRPGRTRRPFTRMAPRSAG